MGLARPVGRVQRWRGIRLDDDDPDWWPSAGRWERAEEGGGGSWQGVSMARVARQAPAPFSPLLLGLTLLSLFCSGPPPPSLFQALAKREGVYIE